MWYYCTTTNRRKNFPGLRGETVQPFAEIQGQAPHGFQNFSNKFHQFRPLAVASMEDMNPDSFLFVFCVSNNNCAKNILFCLFVFFVSNNSFVQKIRKTKWTSVRTQYETIGLFIYIFGYFFINFCEIYVCARVFGCAFLPPKKKGNPILLSSCTWGS